MLLAGSDGAAKQVVGKYRVITFCGSTRSEIEYATATGKVVSDMKHKIKVKVPVEKRGLPRPEKWMARE